MGDNGIKLPPVDSTTPVEVWANSVQEALEEIVTTFARIDARLDELESRPSELELYKVWERNHAKKV